METIQHQGTSPFNPSSGSYQVFRNVKDFGAKGDGVTDDTAAIKFVLVNRVRNFIDVLRPQLGYVVWRSLRRCLVCLVNVRGHSPAMHDI